MNRTKLREIAVHFSYDMGFDAGEADELIDRRYDGEYFSTLGKEDDLYNDRPDAEQMKYLRRIVNGVSEHRPELDGYIDKYSKGWKFSRISMVAVAIMRVAMFEILYMEDVPDGAAINEAVEIAKKYESNETVAFINGILGTFVREEKK